MNPSRSTVYGRSLVCVYDKIAPPEKMTEYHKEALTAELKSR